MQDLVEVSAASPGSSVEAGRRLPDRVRNWSGRMGGSLTAMVDNLTKGMLSRTTTIQQIHPYAKVIESVLVYRYKFKTQPVPYIPPKSVVISLYGLSLLQQNSHSDTEQCRKKVACRV